MNLREIQLLQEAYASVYEETDAERDKRLADRRARVAELQVSGRTMTPARRARGKAQQRKFESEQERLERLANAALSTTQGSARRSEKPMGSTPPPGKERAPESNRRLSSKTKSDTLASRADEVLRGIRKEAYVPLRTSDEKYDDEGFPTRTSNWDRRMGKAIMDVGKEKFKGRVFGNANIARGVSASRRLEQMKKVDNTPESERKKKSEAKSASNRQLGSARRSLETQLNRQHLERSLKAEDFNVFDILISHLLDEGYADDVKNAYVILENMSEDWVIQILDEKFISPFKGPPTSYKDITPLSPATKAMRKSDELQRTEPGSKRQQMQTRRSQQLNRMFQAARRA